MTVWRALRPSWATLFACAKVSGARSFYAALTQSKRVQILASLSPSRTGTEAEENGEGQCFKRSEAERQCEASDQRERQTVATVGRKNANNAGKGSRLLPCITMTDDEVFRSLKESSQISGE